MRGPKDSLGEKKRALETRIAQLRNPTVQAVFEAIEEDLEAIEQSLMGDTTKASRVVSWLDLKSPSNREELFDFMLSCRSVLRFFRRDSFNLEALERKLEIVNKQLLRGKANG